MVIINLLTGQYREPVRVIAFNTAEQRCDLQMIELPISISDFVERFESNDRRQLTLRFA